MKKVLFLIPTFGSGGAEKSFVSLLQNIDYNKFSVDVCALRPVGLTAEMIPPQVNVLPLPPKYGFFAQELPPAVSQLIKKGDFPTAFKRIMYSAVLRKYSFTNVAEQKSFKYLKDALKVFTLITTPQSATLKKPPTTLFLNASTQI